MKCSSASSCPLISNFVPADQPGGVPGGDVWLTVFGRAAERLWGQPLLDARFLYTALTICMFLNCVNNKLQGIAEHFRTLPLVRLRHSI